MDTHEKIQIALADDEALFRKGIQLILSDYPDLKVIIEAENGEDLLAKIQVADDLPDVLLLDLKMPVLNGVQTARIIRERFPSIHIVVLSTYATKAFVLNMVEIGAAAYLAKNSNPEEVVETIRAVHAKGFHYNELVLEVIRENLVQKNVPKPKTPFDPELTNREKEVLQLICEQFTTAEIAEKLFISHRTVDGHRNNLLSKLGCRNTAGLVVYAIQSELIKFDPFGF